MLATSIVGNQNNGNVAIASEPRETRIFDGSDRDDLAAVLLLMASLWWTRLKVAGSRKERQLRCVKRIGEFQNSSRNARLVRLIYLY